MGQNWLGIEDSNLCHLSQSQAYYHYTNPQWIMPERASSPLEESLGTRLFQVIYGSDPVLFLSRPPGTPGLTTLHFCSRIPLPPKSVKKLCFSM